MAISHFTFSVVLCAIAFTRPVVSNVYEVDVLILGAGISGITAGNYLQTNGLRNFLILEAQGYLGGRIKQAKIGNVTVGEGANWVHYVEEGDENPILGLARKINLRRYANNYTDINLRNTPHSLKDFGKTLKDFHEVEKKVIEKNNNGDARKQDEPLSSTLAQHGWLPDTSLKRTAEWITLDFEFALQPALTSSRQFTGVPEKNDIVTDSRGFKGIIDDLARDFTNKIKTGKIVGQIKYNSSDGIEVHTKDGDTYKAKYALCTFSTGVLASDLVEFIPELPSWKKAAISRLPLAYYTNIFAKFPNDFWDDNEFIYNGGSVAETFPLVYNLNKKGIHRGSNVLLFTAVEYNSLRIEAQSKNETKAEVMKTLRKMYPNVTVSEPTEFYVGRFSQNPYVRGSFSNAVVGSTSADFHNLQGRLGNLFFSGEATDEDYWGYTQGGYLTGLKQAKQIFKCWNGLECPEYHPEDGDICTGSPADMVKSSLVVVFLLSLWLMLTEI